MADIGVAAPLSRLGLRALRGLPGAARSASFPRHSTLPTVARAGLGRALLPLQPGPSPRFAYRQYAVASAALTLRPRLAAPTPTLLPRHRRCLGTNSSGVSRHQLAVTEEYANGSPANPSLQMIFYQLLFRANMHAILVERYQSGHFATNATIDALYKKSLAALNAGASQVSSAAGGASLATSGVSPAAAVGSATTAGLNRPGWTAASEAAMPNPAAYAYGFPRPIAGNQSEPIHVIVQESKMAVFYRWLRLILGFTLVAYISFAMVSICVDFLSNLFNRGTSLNHANNQNNNFEAKTQNTRFSDVHGCDEAKEELQEVVEFLKHPDKFTQLGAKLPKGVLLVGPPGTGKTLLARAVAGEAGVPFFYMSGSEFDEIFVGVGAKRVRQLFSNAKSKSPAIIFIDELDAIGGKRQPRDHAHSKQTLNQLLTELDGFDQDTKIIIIAATNLPNLLDKALIRPGRFDRHISVDLPDVRGRIAILKHHSRKIKLADDVNLTSLASRTGGHSGAELENMLNLAAIRASRSKANMISKADLDWAYDRIKMGSEKKSFIMSEKEKEMTAYHESGHALVRLFDKQVHAKLYKVTILPRGGTLGHTAFVPAMDKYSMSAAEIRSNIRVALGGLMAEELRYGNENVTSGGSQDLEVATNLGFSMVAQCGMSSVLGPINFSDRYEKLSSETKAVIEAEVQKALKQSNEEVRQLLTEKRKELDLLAQALLKYETLSREEVEIVIRGESLPGRPVVSSGAMVVPVPSEQPPSPGLGGVPQPARETPVTPEATE